MNSFPSKAIVEQLRQRFPAGTRVRLIKMNDDFTNLQPGDEGTVEFIDDCGSIFCAWDRGASLGVVFGVDEVRKIGGNDND